MSQSIRELFGIPDDVVYLNCAALAPTMSTVCEAGIGGLMHRARPWTLSSPEAQFADADRARALFARLINAAASDVAIVPSTSYAVAVAARNLTLGQGRSVVMPSGQHYSNVFQWLVKARDVGAKAIMVRRPASGSWTDPLVTAIDANTDIVAVPACDWIDGRLVDLERVAARTREVGASLVVDATQSLGVLPLDVAAIRPDFLACSAFKWLLGPSNLAVLYAAPWRQDGVPIEQHALNRKSYLSPGRSLAGATVDEEFVPGASRYDMGQRNQHILLPMLSAGLEAIERWGLTTIRDGITALSDHLSDELARLGFDVADREDHAPHILGIALPDDVAASLAGRLANEQIYVTVRDGRLRISPHLYNSVQDIERLVTAMRAIFADNRQRATAR